MLELLNIRIMNSTILVAMNYVKNRPVLQTYRPVKRLLHWVPVTFRLIKIDGKVGVWKIVGSLDQIFGGLCSQLSSLTKGISI